MHLITVRLVAQIRAKKKAPRKHFEETPLNVKTRAVTTRPERAVVVVVVM